MKIKTYYVVFSIFITLVLSSCEKVQLKSIKMPDNPVKALQTIDPVPLQVNQLTLREKLYQSMILGFQGTSINPELQNLLDNKLGGVILFSRNITSTDQTVLLNDSILKQSALKPFIAVDQEGGRVNRLPAAFGNTPSAYSLGQSDDINYIYSQGALIGKNLKALKFNVDFSTVLDTWTNAANTVIGDRSFGTTPDEVIKYAKLFNQGIESQGIITSGKHFPGHGDTSVDSHVGLPIDEDSIERLKAVEMKPFNALKDEVDMMMVSHIMATSIDRYPSSLSKVMVTDILKNQMGYQGIIITDDLAMGAIENEYSRLDAVTKALQAGNTMILIGSDTGDIDGLVSALEVKVKSGEISLKQINENIEKIIRLKLKYGIL